MLRTVPSPVDQGEEHTGPPPGGNPVLWENSISLRDADPLLLPFFVSGKGNSSYKFLLQPPDRESDHSRKGTVKLSRKLPWSEFLSGYGTTSVVTELPGLQAIT